MTLSSIKFSNTVLCLAYGALYFLGLELTSWLTSNSFEVELLLTSLIAGLFTWHYIQHKRQSSWSPLILVFSLTCLFTVLVLLIITLTQASASPLAISTFIRNTPLAQWLSLVMPSFVSLVVTLVLPRWFKPVC